MNKVFELILYNHEGKETNRVQIPIEQIVNQGKRPLPHCLWNLDSLEPACWALWRTYETDDAGDEKEICGNER